MSAIGQPAAAAISAGAQIAATELTNKTNLDISREYNANQQRLAKQQNDWNVAQWNRENEYNSPLAQSRRLKEAGLSSAAAAQSVSGVPASPLQSADLGGNSQAPTPMQAPDLSSLSGFDLIGAARQLQALKRDKIENEKAENELDVQPKMLMTELDVKEANLAYARQSLEQAKKSFPYSLKGMKWDVYLKSAQYENAKLNARQQRMNIRLSRQKFGFLEKMNQSELDKMTAEIKNLQKTGKQIDAKTDEILASTENIKEQKEGISTENRIKDLQKTLIEHGMPNSVAQRIGALVTSGKVNFDEVANSLQIMSQYIHSGYKQFVHDPKTQRFFEYIFDEGESMSRQRSVSSSGFMRDAADDVLNLLQ